MRLWYIIYWCPQSYNNYDAHPLDVDECFDATLQNCVNAQCIDTDGSFECECLPGYTKPLLGGNICEGIYSDTILLSADYI